MQRLGGGQGHALHLGELLRRSFSDFFNAAKVGQQRPAPRGADAGHILQAAVQGVLFPKPPVVGDGETVALIPDALD